MHGVWDLNYDCLFVCLFYFFLNQADLYTFSISVILIFVIFESMIGSGPGVWWFYFVCFLSPHQTQVQVNKNIIKTKKMLHPFTKLQSNNVSISLHF